MANNSSQKSVFGFCSSRFSRASTLIFGNSEKLQQSIEFTRSITQRMGVVLCKDF